jgi:hypothetical protein
MTAPTGSVTPPQYTVGWIKQDIYATNASAIRTNIETSNNFKDWMVATIDHGGHYASWDDVADWPDVSTTRALTGGEGTLSAIIVSVEEPTNPVFAGDGVLSATTTAALTTQTSPAPAKKTRIRKPAP